MANIGCRNKTDQHVTTPGEAVRGDPSKIQNFTDLVAWQKARALVRRVYEATERFPREEAYGLTQQLRRASVSVPSNIAEGYGRGSRKEYMRYIQMARGSLYEIQTQLWLAQDIGYLTPGQTQSLVDEATECIRLVQGLLRALRKSQT